MYRHALPPGFVLKSELKEMEANKLSNELSLEMLVEKERASLGKNVTKVTLESFLAWKKRKIIEKKEEKVAICLTLIKIIFHDKKNHMNRS